MMEKIRQMGLLSLVILGVVIEYHCVRAETCPGRKPDVPSCNLQIFYDKDALGCKEAVVVQRAQSQPRVAVGSADVSSKLTYLLLMIDPDAPTACPPPQGYWLHWMAVVKEVDETEQFLKIIQNVVEYAGPSPPQGSGPHRYQFSLYPTDHSIPDDVVPKKRGKFSLEQFLIDAKINSEPSATFQFISEVPPP